MAVLCPNFSDLKVKDIFNKLVKEYSENKAYYYWDKYKGEIPNEILNPDRIKQWEDLPGKTFQNTKILTEFYKDSADSYARRFPNTQIRESIDLRGNKVYQVLVPKPESKFYSLQDKNWTIEEFNNYVKGIKEVTNEYGDDWKEMTILPEHRNYILLQLANENKISPIQTLDIQLKEFAKQLNIKIEDVNKLPYDVVAVANILENVIQVVRKKANKFTLSEEVSHFFVELLEKNSTLYKAMYQIIDSYDVYKTTLELYGNNIDYQKDGKVDIDKIKKEAIGKLISQHLVNIAEEKQTKDLQKSDNWFGRVISVITEFINRALRKTGITSFKPLLDKINGEYSINPFKQSAERILSSNVEGLSRENIIDNTYFQQDVYQEKLVNSYVNSQDRIKREDVKQGDETSHVYRVDEGSKLDITVSATTVAKEDTRKKTKYFVESEDVKKFWELRRLGGEQIHAYLEDIIKNLTSKSPVLETSVYKVLNRNQQQLYKQAELGAKVVIDYFLKETPGSKFLTEVRVYNRDLVYKDERGVKHKGIGGTIDLLVVHPNGKVSIIDWKTFYGKDVNDKLNTYKMMQDSHQIDIYKKILLLGNEELGIPPVKGFEKTRLLTFRSTYDKEKTRLESLFASEIIPVAGETTGNKELDSKIAHLEARLEKLLTQKRPFDIGQRQKFAITIQNLRETITTLRLQKEYNEVLDNAYAELTEVDNILMSDNITGEDLKDVKEIVDLYRDITSFMDLENKNPEYISKFEQVQTRALRLEEKIYRRYIQIAESVAEDVGVQNLYEKKKQLRFFAKMFRSISQYDHPIFITFNKLLNTQIAKTKQQSDDFRKATAEQLEKLKTKAKSKGLSLKEAYDKLVNKNTGNLISKFKSEWFTTKEKAQQSKDIKWLENNTEVDLELVDKFRKSRQEALDKNVFFGTLAKITAKRKYEQNKIDEWYKSQITLTTSRYLRIKKSAETKWLSNEWNEINTRDNEYLLEFYNYFTKNIAELSQHLPDFNDKGKSGFLPNIYANLVDELSQSDTPGKVLTRRLQDLYKVKLNEDQSLGMFDANGQREYTVPHFYTERIDADKKSYDLGMVLQLYAEMSYNYQNMSAIESKTQALLEVLKKQEAIQTTGGGNIFFKKKNFETILSKEANKEYVDAFQKFVNGYLYGIKNEDVSTFSKVVDKANKATAFNMLSANPFVGITAGMANLAGTHIKAAGGKYFNTADIWQSFYLLTGGTVSNREDKDIAVGLLELFDPFLDDRDFAKTRKLSESFLVRNLTFDQWFLAIRKPDEFTQKIIATAMLKNFTVKDGKIILIEDYLKSLRPENYYHLNKEERATIDDKISQEKNKIENLIDLSEFDSTTNKIKINGLELVSLEEVMKFRNVIKQVSKTIVGNMDKNDTYLYKQQALWRALMLFRNWMPRIIDDRFGELRYNHEMDKHEIGRYRIFAQMLFSKSIEDANKVKWNMLLGPEKVAKIKYQEYKTKTILAGGTPMTENDFVDLYKAELNSMVRELQIIAGILALSVSGKAYFDDDDKLSAGEKYTLKVINRTYSELTMFVNPLEAMNILKSPAAATAPLSNFVRMMYHASREGFGALIEDEKMRKNAKPMKYFIGFFPFAAAERNFREFNKNWNDFIEDK